ncbi:unnamed protein product [Linum trigynum]|uniref:Uncharacterized protein n=1 Tax=Linum trigynum TaxID=586398 RepID=A0AAV2E1M1_9ROSI
MTHSAEPASASCCAAPRFARRGNLPSFLSFSLGEPFASFSGDGIVRRLRGRSARSILVSVLVMLSILDAEDGEKLGEVPLKWLRSFFYSRGAILLFGDSVASSLFGGGRPFSFFSGSALIIRHHGRKPAPGFIFKVASSPIDVASEAAINSPLRAAMGIAARLTSHVIRAVGGDSQRPCSFVASCRQSLPTSPSFFLSAGGFFSSSSHSSGVGSGSTIVDGLVVSAAVGWPDSGDPLSFRDSLPAFLSSSHPNMPARLLRQHRSMVDPLLLSS